MSGSVQGLWWTKLKIGMMSYCIRAKARHKSGLDSKGNKGNKFHHYIGGATESCCKDIDR